LLLVVLLVFLERLVVVSFVRCVSLGLELRLVLSE